MFKSRFIRAFTASALLASSLALCACASAPGTQTAPLNIAQVVAVVCPLATDAIGDAVNENVFTGGAAATLTNQVEPDFAAVCAKGATVTSDDLTTLANAAFPAIETAIGNSSLNADDKKDVLFGVTSVQALLQTYLALHPQAAPVPASGVVASE